MKKDGAIGSNYIGDVGKTIDPTRALVASPSPRVDAAPGQYATLGIEGMDRHSHRPYSIVSSPLESEIEFFFELVPNGAFTPSLYKLQTGDELRITLLVIGVDYREDSDLLRLEGVSLNLLD